MDMLYYSEVKDSSRSSEMIISASRRTDIPALYPEWFVNRLRENYVMVPNPYNRKKVSSIRLTPEVVDCIAFWTKDPEPMIPYLREIDRMGYNYYFQMTITDYEKDLEPNVPGTAESMATFLLLSEMIGKERIDWRFDPIVLTEKYSLDYHAEQFETMCQWLHDATERCIISFMDDYGNNGFPELEPWEMEAVAERLSGIAARYGLPLYTCAEKIDLSRYGIQHGACIDPEKIRKLIGYKLDLKKAHSQRPECRCAESIDVGMYGTCVNGCKYCYATGSVGSVHKKYEQHDPYSPLLTGHLRGDETITEKKMYSNADHQISLFDLPGMYGDF